MAEASSGLSVFTARLAVVLVVCFLVLGVLLYGFSAEDSQRLWQDISQRPGGPMTFRFILQPAMSALAALHDGMQDAALGRAPFLMTVLTNPVKRMSRIREALISTSRIILLGLVMDAVYQYIVLKTFYPGEAVVIAVLLALVPYLLLRGPFARLARLWHGRKAIGRAS